MNVTNRTLLERVRRDLRRPKSDGWVYMIGATEVQKVKIGFSGNPKQRLRDLSAGSPLELKILAQWRGTIQDEKTLHWVMKAHRAHGEWFRLEGEVLALLNEKTPKPAPRRQMWPDGTSRRLTELLLSVGRPRTAARMKRYLTPRPEGEPLERVADMFRPHAELRGVHPSWIAA